MQGLIYGQSPTPALGPRRVQELIHHAKERGQKLLALEASAKAEAFFLLHATVERAGEETRLAAEVGNLQLMVEGQTEFDRETWMLEELQLQDAHRRHPKVWLLQLAVVAPLVVTSTAPTSPFAQLEHHRFFRATGSPKLGACSWQPSHFFWEPPAPAAFVVKSSPCMCLEAHRLTNLNLACR
jgi:hypothetical protein